MFNLRVRSNRLMQKSALLTKASLIEFSCVVCHNPKIKHVYELSCQHFACRNCVKPKCPENCPRCDLPIDWVTGGSCRAQSWAKIASTLVALHEKRDELLAVEAAIDDVNNACGDSTTSQNSDVSMAQLDIKDPFKPNDLPFDFDVAGPSNQRPVNQRPVKIFMEKIVQQQGECEILEEEISESNMGQVEPSVKNVDFRNSKGETQLHNAAAKGDLDRVRTLIELGAAVTVQDFNGWVPLHEAAIAGHKLVCAKLMDCHAIIDVPGGEFNWTPLHEAVRNNHRPVVRLLLNRGALATYRDRKGRTPICFTSDTHMQALLCKKHLIPRMYRPGGSKCQRPINHRRLMYAYKLKPEDVARMVLYIKCNHVFLSETLSDKVTHVILESKDCLCNTSTTYLKGILMGVKFHDADWLRERLGTRWGTELNNHYIKGSVNFPKSCAPIRAMQNMMYMRPKLLDGMSFYIRGMTGTYPYHGENLTKDQIIELIELGGGKILKRQPREDIPDEELFVPFHAREKDRMAKCSHVILYLPGDLDIKYNMAHLKALPLQWLFDAIESFTVRRNNSPKSLVN